MNRKFRLDLDALAVDSFDTQPAARPGRGTVFGHATLYANGCLTEWGVCYGDTGLRLYCSTNCAPQTWEGVSCLQTDCEPSCFEACGPAPTDGCTAACQTRQGQATCDYTGCGPQETA